MREKDNFELSNNIEKEITELVMFIIFNIEKVFQDNTEVLNEIMKIDFKYLPSPFLKDLILEIVKLQLNNINLIEVLNVKNLKKKIDEVKEKTKDDFNYYYNSFSVERVREIKKKLETFYYCKKVLNLFNNQENKNIMLDFKSNILEIANEIQVNAEVVDENAELREIPKLVDEAHKTENSRILTNTPLDHFLYFEKKEVNTIIAETGLGKTAFVLDLALRLTNNGYKGIFFSCEMDLVKLGHRIIANQLQVPLTLVQNKKTYEKMLEREDIKKEIKKIEERRNLKLYNGTFTISKIESYIKKFKLAQENIDFIVIDYLQLLHLDEKGGGTTYEKTSEISRSLKRIARDYNISVFCISQLSRAYQERRERLKKGEKFYLSVTDIKDSSQVEMDASIIIGLVAESIEKDALGEKKLVNLQILKNRLGARGTDYYVEFITQTQKINYARLEKLFNYVPPKEETEEVEEIEEQQRMF
jgi:replicative DNA helicase